MLKERHRQRSCHLFLFSAEGLGLVKWELHLIITMGRPLFRDVDFAFSSGWTRKRGIFSTDGWMDGQEGRLSKTCLDEVLWEGYGLGRSS